MSNPPAPVEEKASIVLLRKVIIFILLVVGATILMTILFTYNRLPAGLWTYALLSTGMGLAAGLASRWVLGRYPLPIRIISGLIFLAAGLETLGLFTGWQAGLDPFTPGFEIFSWKNLAQFAWGAGITLLALLAWQIRRQPGIQQARTRRNTSRPIRSRWPNARLPGESRRSGNRQFQKPSSAKVISSKKRMAPKKPVLRLSEKVENRCPYCLQEIKPNDPRGTVECKVCHTLHHKDCWAVTGTCQVPHFTA